MLTSVRRFGLRSDGLAHVMERAYGTDRPEYPAGYAYQQQQSPPPHQYIQPRERLVTPVDADMTSMRAAYGMAGVPFAAHTANHVVDQRGGPNMRVQRYGAYQPTAPVSPHPHTTPMPQATPSYPYENPSQILANLQYGFNMSREAPPVHAPTNCLPQYRPPPGGFGIRGPADTSAFLRPASADVPALFSDADRARAILQNLQNLQHARRFENGGGYQ